MPIVRTDPFGSDSAVTSIERLALARPRARWRMFLRVLMSMLIFAIAGPLSIAHASMHVPFAGSAYADGTEGLGAKVSASKLKDGTQAPSAVQHQHCAVCPAASAIHVDLPYVSSPQTPKTVTYSLPSLDDRAKFAPPPLRKPPRI